MKFVLSIIALVFMGLTSYAQTGLNANPFKPEEDRRFRRLEQKTVAKYFWDFSVQGGASTGAITLRPYYSAASLPANAIITRSYFVNNTAFTSPGSLAKAAFACGSANLLSATTISGNIATQYSVLDGLQTGASTAFSTVGASSCSPTITFSVQAATAGRLDAWIEYIKPADINGQ